MVGSRHLQGTIISRISYLLKSGSLKQPPIWYDIVRRFPPPKTALLSLIADQPSAQIPKTLYPDDDVKREFYVKYGRAKRDPESLFPDIKTEETKTDYFLKYFHESISKGVSHKDAMEQSLETFRQYLLSLRDEKFENAKKGDRNFEDKTKESSKADLSTDDIYDIFSKNRK